jgi:hypothetical protein
MGVVSSQRDRMAHESMHRKNKPKTSLAKSARSQSSCCSKKRNKRGGK